MSLPSSHLVIGFGCGVVVIKPRIGEPSRNFARTDGKKPARMSWAARAGHAAISSAQNSDSPAPRPNSDWCAP